MTPFLKWYSKVAGAFLLLLLPMAALFISGSKGDHSWLNPTTGGWIVFLYFVYVALGSSYPLLSFLKQKRDDWDRYSDSEINVPGTLNVLYVLVHAAVIFVSIVTAALIMGDTDSKWSNIWATEVLFLSAIPSGIVSGFFLVESIRLIKYSYEKSRNSPELPEKADLTVDMR